MNTELLKVKLEAAVKAVKELPLTPMHGADKQLVIPHHFWLAVTNSLVQLTGERQETDWDEIFEVLDYYVRLQKAGVTGFLICALNAHSFPEKVAAQIEQTNFGNSSDEYLQRLRKRWVRMILFASKIKPGMKYYVPDITSPDKVQELVWDNDGTDNRVFGNGLCFIQKEEAIMFANKLLGMI